MRLVLGAALLLTLFVLTTVLHARWTSELRAQRAAARAGTTTASQPADGSTERAADGRGPLGRLAELADDVADDLLDGAPGRGRSARPQGPPPEGWGRVVIGRPSGAAPVPAPWEALPPAEPAGAPLGRPLARPPVLAQERELAPPPPPAGADFELVVQDGQILSRICQQFYGSARPELVEALASYNDLASPDKLKVGQKLRLPPDQAALLAAAPSQN